MNKSLYCECHEECFALCINPKCAYVGIMCEQGSKSKSQCGYDHQSCKKVQWKQFEKLVNQNPRKNTKQFHQIQNKIDHLFIDLISKIKEEHTNFKFWLTTYGLSMEAIGLISSVNEQSVETITGKVVSPILLELSNTNEPLVLPKINQKQINRIKQTIEIEFINLAQVYLKKLKLQELEEDVPQSIRQSSETRSTQQDNSFLKNSRVKLSRIIENPNQLVKLFSKPIKTMKLLYRASQNNFSTKRFHELCDGVSHTLVVIKNEFNKVFGGYSVLKWTKQKKGFESDQSCESFMFTMNPTEKYKLSLQQFAIAQSIDGGPIFGCNDLLLVDQANINQSKSQFPICYKNDKLKRSAQASLNFCGSKIGKFLIKEWEVFQVQFDKQGIEEEFMKIF